MPQKVIVGVDSSETSREAFREAIRQAESRGLGVTAIHNVPFPALTEYHFATIDPTIVITAGTEFLTKELAQLETEYPGGFPVTVEPLVTQGHAGSNITDVAAAPDDEGMGAELLVLGSRGYGGIRGPLLGSVTTFAVHHLPCPLLILPAQKEQ